MSQVPFDSSTPSLSSKGKAADIVRRDDEYYIESSFIVFQVEKSLFRVPSYLFSKESQFFGGLFALPQPNANAMDGTASVDPVVLPEQFGSQDFKNLLKAIYPLSVSLHLSLTKSEWISVLKLSTIWYFLKLRAMAISELDRMNELNPVEKITLGREVGKLSWVVKGFEELVQRDSTITDDEAIDIDTDHITTVYRLFRIREFRLRQIFNFSPTLKQEIENVFEEELDDIRAREQGFKTPDEDIPFEQFIPEVPRAASENLADEEPFRPSFESDPLSPGTVADEPDQEFDNWGNIIPSVISSALKKKKKKK